MKKTQSNIGIKNVDKHAWKYLKLMCTLDGLKVSEEVSKVIMEVAKRRNLIELEKLIK